MLKLTVVPLTVFACSSNGDVTEQVADGESEAQLRFTLIAVLVVFMTLRFTNPAPPPAGIVMVFPPSSCRANGPRIVSERVVEVGE